MIEGLRLAQRIIDLADGDPTSGNLIFGSPLAFATRMGGAARCAWDSRAGRATPRRPSHGMCAPTRRPGRRADLLSTFFRFPVGACCPTRPPCGRPPTRLRIAEQSGDDLLLPCATRSRPRPGPSAMVRIGEGVDLLGRFVKPR